MKTISSIFLGLLLVCGAIRAQDSNSEASGIESIRKNSIYMEALGNGVVYSVNYDRILPVGEKLAITLRLGANEYHGEATDTLSFNFLGAAGMLYGGTRHFFEGTIGYTYFMHDPDRLVVLTAGYRFQGPKGLVVRATPMYIFNSEKGDTFGNSLWFGLSFGYSF